MEIDPKIKEKIVLALDVDNISKAKEMILELKDYVGVFKIGLQLYTANGGEIFKFMKEQNIDFFFDVKLLDIPNTVAKASENIIRNGAAFYNVHTMGGSEMMRKSAISARKTALEIGAKKPIVLGVTVLTSISDDTLNNQLKVPLKSNDYVTELAKLAKESSLDGVVASVWEARRIKQACGKDFKVLCPGIRPEWASKNDQKRLATPKKAIQEGADYLVIGRAVTAYENRVEAMKKIYDEIENTMLTQNESSPNSTAKLILENGMIFEGESIGATGIAYGEIVFNTSMSGYQEILTDPSYAEQIIVMTYPEIGNYGINKEDSECGKVQAKGLIVKNACSQESHYKSIMNISDYLKQNNIIALNKVDTRLLTKIIRESGDMSCAITTNEITRELKENIKKFKVSNNITLEVSTYKKEKIAGCGVKVAIIDLGAKKSIIENLKKYNADITIFPADIDSKVILEEEFDAVILSNGPGDPKDATKTIETAKNLLGKISLYGICLGHQILAIVTGAQTYKLKYGHRGGNHPVINLQSNKVFMTAQNHGYAIKDGSLPDCVEVTYRNLNDGTIEGIKSDKYKLESVQFHPEAAPGPNDTDIIFKNWIQNIRKESELCQKI
ncbi:MAG: glutamine-hydrolyzing carbamoyl-phosphate synthase small subunit [Candidatus Gastranaerophilales bacterium]|nr:glutamine-hydrolyzing carbamoyl-phosphate synthase small subunit [Candidatus Gastranaerophilales bacterium]